MNDVYAVVLDADPLKKIQSQKRAIEMLAKQTTECAYFISHYARETGFCEWVCPHQISSQKYMLNSHQGSRLGKNIAGGAESKIEGFEKAFQSLRAVFQERAILQTELFLLRMMSDVEAIGKCSVL